MLVTEQHINQHSVCGPGHLNNLTHTHTHRGRSVPKIQTPLHSHPKSLHLSTLRPGLLLKPFGPSFPAVNRNNWRGGWAQGWCRGRAGFSFRLTGPCYQRRAPARGSVPKEPAQQSRSRQSLPLVIASMTLLWSQRWPSWESLTGRVHVLSHADVLLIQQLCFSMHKSYELVFFHHQLRLVNTVKHMQCIEKCRRCFPSLFLSQV